ncbi:MAG: tetratricopeptide repeat protein [Treponema sp.]|jgi:tetratricopeptide (TPR) repeat protein|nr:tetratricopeptide repeat protein [Treponema sp.]
MFNSRTLSRYGRHIFLLKRIKTLAISFFIILAVAASILIIFKIKNSVSDEKRELLQVFNNGEYEKSYEISKNQLLQRPVDYFLLTINGFSAFQLGISQINSQNTLLFIDECIFSLRKALIRQTSSNNGRIYYVLGKAYGYKGNEYSDLAVKYLEMASQSYKAADIPEYLGLAYAASGDYRNSVAAFSQAFVPDKPPSDSLLLSIARSYMAMEEYDMAIGYLRRCVDISPDSKSVAVARLLIAEIYVNTGDYSSAEEQYFSILNEFGANAEVHYQLGELYSLQGDTTRARSEWRTAYRLDPAHVRARARLNI